MTTTTTMKYDILGLVLSSESISSAINDLDNRLSSINLNSTNDVQEIINTIQDIITKFGGDISINSKITLSADQNTTVKFTQHPITQYYSTDYYVTWGDSNTSEKNSITAETPTHTFENSGLYTIIVGGIMEGTDIVQLGDSVTECNIISVSHRIDDDQSKKFITNTSDPIRRVVEILFCDRQPYQFDDSLSSSEMVWATSLRIPSHVKCLDIDTLSCCRNISELHIPYDSELTSIGKNVYKNLNSMKSLYIPDGVTSIGDYAFSGCTQIKYLRLPASLDSIGTNVLQFIPNDCCIYGPWTNTHTHEETMRMFKGDYVEYSPIFEDETSQLMLMSSTEGTHSHDQHDWSDYEINRGDIIPKYSKYTGPLWIHIPIASSLANLVEAWTEFKKHLWQWLQDTIQFIEDILCGVCSMIWDGVRKSWCWGFVVPISYANRSVTNLLGVTEGYDNVLGDDTEDPVKNREQLEKSIDNIITTILQGIVVNIKYTIENVIDQLFVSAMKKIGEGVDKLEEFKNWVIESIRDLKNGFLEYIGMADTHTSKRLDKQLNKLSSKYSLEDKQQTENPSSDKVEGNGTVGMKDFCKVSRDVLKDLIYGDVDVSTDLVADSIYGICGGVSTLDKNSKERKEIYNNIAQKCDGIRDTWNAFKKLLRKTHDLLDDSLDPAQYIPSLDLLEVQVELAQQGDLKIIGRYEDESEILVNTTITGDASGYCYYDTNANATKYKAEKYLLNDKIPEKFKPNALAMSGKLSHVVQSSVNKIENSMNSYINEYT